MNDENEIVEVVEVLDQPPQRDARGYFSKGNSLGVGRRPTRVAEAVAAAIEPLKTELIQRAMHIARTDASNAGVQAIKVLLERLAPAPKAQDEVVVVPGLAAEPTWEGKCRCVIAAVAEGQISAQAGKTILTMITEYTRALAADRFEVKLAELERLIRGGGGTVVDIQATSVTDAAAPISDAEHDLT